MVVTIRKNAHTPISAFVKLRMRMIKFAKPKSVNEKRWRKVNIAERIQYDDKYFFKGVAYSLIEEPNLHKKSYDIIISVEMNQVIEF